MNDDFPRSEVEQAGGGGNDLRMRVERLAAENTFLRAQLRPRIRFIGSGAMRQSGDNLQAQIPRNHRDRPNYPGQIPRDPTCRG